MRPYKFSSLLGIKSLKSIRRRLLVTLKYGNFERFVKIHSGIGFRGKWTEDVACAPANEADIIETIVNSFLTMKRDQKQVARLFLPTHEWEKLLAEDLRGLGVSSGRIDRTEITCFLRNFFRNEGISGVWGGTNMYDKFLNSSLGGDVTRACRMIDQLAAWRTHVPNAQLNELDAPRIGNPWGYDLDGYLVYEPAMEYDFQSRYFSRLLNQSSKPVVLEIGGGFGGLAYNLLKRNSELTYIGVDLPVLGLLKMRPEFIKQALRRMQFRKNIENQVFPHPAFDVVAGNQLVQCGR